MPEVPRRRVGHVNRPGDPRGAYALLGSEDQRDGHEPLPEGQVRAVEDGAGRDAKPEFALITLVLVPLFDLVDAVVVTPKHRTPSGHLNSLRSSQHAASSL